MGDKKYSEFWGRAVEPAVHISCIALPIVGAHQAAVTQVAAWSHDLPLAREYVRSMPLTCKIVPRLKKIISIHIYSTDLQP